MREKFGKKSQPIMKILVIGLVILIICLSVCTFLITVLKSSYENEISMDFQSHHISTGAALDNDVKDVIAVMHSASRMLGDERYSYTANRIYLVLDSYNGLDNITTMCFMATDGVLYYNENAYPKNEIGSSWDVLWSKLDPEADIYTETSTKDFGFGSGHILIVTPVHYGNSFKGYLVASMALTDLFEEEMYQYQNEMGECYLMNESGTILSRSSDALIAPEEADNLQIALMQYSDGKERSKKAMQMMNNDIARPQAGYVSFTTSQAETLQVSYYPLETVPGTFFVSVYNDNLVDDKVQPLISRSVLSCIAIIVLMIAIIVYVWATAKKANVTIEKLAYEDSVTKGKNINYFKDFANDVMSVFKETPFVIYRFDIANFRYINEAYGHSRADEVLISCIKNFHETFSEKELCVRMNADQFLAIIVNDKTVEQKLEQFRGKVNEDARSRGIKYPIRFKTGIYQIKKHDHNIDDMIDHANIARKTLNGDEKEMTAYYSDRIVTDMRKVDRIESEMQRALATGEFKVYLQPKWDIVADHVAGAEALVRWIRADGSMVYPDEFIPVFENNGFIEKLDFYMLESVCSQIHDLLEAGKTVYPVSVNQSRLLLHSPDYVKNVEKIIKNYNIPPYSIELEITESVFLDERQQMIETMNRLKQIGVRLSMDDFGSGYSSLNMLKDIPFDTIKFDRGFFSESITSESNIWILRKMLEMINGLGKAVICEGVETGEQSSLLLGMGCRMVQGYYYSKPIPAEEYIDKYCSV